MQSEDDLIERNDYDHISKKSNNIDIKLSYYMVTNFDVRFLSNYLFDMKYHGHTNLI